ncbi:MAG: hypothetical protein M0002_05955 [Rhodospirillales bacterium]|nr:hypothetical protein [Rhodospirillales bacterium]
MQSASEVRVLSNWCHARAFRWLAVGGPEERGMLLEPAAGRRPWQRVRLLADPEGWRLEDERGETLATASALPALLDAVDGGVAAEPAGRDERQLRAGYGRAEALSGG